MLSSNCRYTTEVETDRILRELLIFVTHCTTNSTDVPIIYGKAFSTAQQRAESDLQSGPLLKGTDVPHLTHVFRAQDGARNVVGHLQDVRGRRDLVPHQHLPVPR